jgi:hypothetical protein
VFVAALDKRANFRKEPQEKINSVFNKLSWQRIFQLFRINRLSSALEKTFNQRCFSEKNTFGILDSKRREETFFPKLRKHRLIFFCEFG